METKSIPMEAETLPMLLFGFSTVIVITTVVLLYLCMKNRNAVYAWFIGHNVLLCISFIFIHKVLFKSTISNSMVSENISLSIGLSALFWAIGMGSLLTGVWRLSKSCGTKEVR